MKQTLIKTEKQYEKVLERLNVIFDSKLSSSEGQEAELLILLIESCEEDNYAIESPDPIAAVRIRMEELQPKQKDLIGIVGSKGIVSEVINRKRGLSVKMIRNWSEHLKITPTVLIQDYELN
ncbi:MAG: HTH-type transcriptional regulator/antitoxin HigA [Saprospiraceae bacterium]|jgi:HTH-type transcriptional regulator/antitoxin HigA